MRIKEYPITIDEKKMNSPIKYERDFLIEIGNQHATVFTVPEAFLELAREAGSTSPTRNFGQPLGQPRGVIAPLSRTNSRGGGLGGFSYNNNNNPVGGGFAFGRLTIPPPPPTSHVREPKKIIEIKPVEKLLESNPNAWKPTRAKQRGPAAEKVNEEKSEEEIRLEAVVKETRAILNKLTPENFDRLMVKFNAISLEDNEDRIAAVINVLFEKALDEPSFSGEYAKMVVQVCQSSQVTSKIFRKLILDKCQREFQKSNTGEDKIKELESQLKDLELETVSEEADAEANKNKKVKMELEVEDLRIGIRRRSLGNVRFIGELYKRQMLSPKIMVECVKLLLATPDDEHLECLCKLLSTVGQKLDTQLSETEVKLKAVHGKLPANFEEKQMDKFFVTLNNLSENKKISQRVRFGIMDVCDLRQTGWVPRRQVGGPKTITEVHQDAYMQELEDKRQIQSLPALSPDSPGAAHGRGGGQGHGHVPFTHVPKKSDWTTVNKADRFKTKRPENPGNQSFGPQPGQSWMNNNNSNY